MSNATMNQLSKEELRAFRRLHIVKSALDELKRRGITTDLPICPVCKSPRIIDVRSSRDLGLLGGFQPAYYCIDCGWYGRTIIIMSNRPENDAILEDMRDAFASLYISEDSHVSDDDWRD
ncbi:hypothetical protein EU527_09275 [Candidatus Thorarchaeota archaeon]|nr:MAG: hypothetical protein EU527_09275 [Candidatus Thorarchaeota archaeon]